jgi:hypothetical protein
LREREADQLLFKARIIVQACNEMGVAAVAVGPYDFAAGYETLKGLADTAAFPFLCANLLDRATGKPLFPPYTILEAANHKVGIIGVLDSAEEVEGLEAIRQSVRVDAVYTTVKRYGEELRARGCDLVLVLSAADPKRFRLLAKKIPEVDLYITGDPDDKLQLPWRIGSAMVVSATQLGKYLGHLQVEWPQGRVQLRNQFEPMRPSSPGDPTVKRIVDGYYTHLAMLRRQEPSRYVKDDEEEVNLKQGGAVFVSASRCRGCHQPQFERWSTTAHAAAYDRLPEEARVQGECLECHVTGYGAVGGYGGAGPDLRGVQCEVCHGAGSLHPAVDMARSGKAVEKVCRQCHTPSRSPSFDLRTYLSREACAAAADQHRPGAAKP